MAFFLILLYLPNWYLDFWLVKLFGLDSICGNLLIKYFSFFCLYFYNGWVLTECSSVHVLDFLE